MIFGIGPGEFIGLALIAIFFVGPERLPKFSSDAAKFLKKVKNLANTATAELRENLGPGFEHLQPSDLNPKTFIQKQIAGALDEEKPKIPVQPKIDPDLL
jgi:sec-independent protein translocase protein TatB